ncbi:hypothetical protein HDA40_000241 [Hamadaea flava]|uniref:DUF2771 family protein n=1 Tax=Hamadaea flava TaxID=1742688 RepID=A0ABV8LTB5_9ACTN|nr:hypothetical protein [Hamadaea flava]MCP2321734.1 hypothetical protein [Hamadaea flava]
MADPSEADRATPAVRLLTILGLIAAVVLVATAVVLVVSWPTAPERGSPLPIRLYAYDLATGRASNSPRASFQAGEIPAATIAEEDVDDGPTGPVRASWYDSLGYRTNGEDLDDLGDLVADPVPLSTTSAVPAGDYQFVLEGIRGGQAVEVLAWVHVEISR